MRSWRLTIAAVVALVACPAGDAPGQPTPPATPRAATGSAIMGVDPAGTVTFFSAGSEQLLGYRAAEVVGLHSIADFIDPAQIDERRQTIDAMRQSIFSVLKAQAR